MPPARPKPRTWVLSVPYEDRRIAQAAGARWDGARKAYLYVGAVLPHALTVYASPPYSWERWLEDDLNGRVAPPEKAETVLAPRPHQSEAVRAIAKAAAAGARGFLLADDVGVGKAQPVSANVLTPSGFCRIGDIRVGDQVIGRDGTPTAVLGVYPQGRRQISVLRFSDGATVRCDDNHLWAVSATSHPGRDDTFVMTTSDIATVLARHSRLDLHVPLAAAADFGDLTVNPEQAYQAGRTVGGHTMVALPPGLHPLLAEVAAGHVGALPYTLLATSAATRLAVLRGLLDVAGRVHRRGGVKFTTVHPLLAYQVSWLAASLGGVGSLDTKRSKRRVTHTVTVLLPTHTSPFLNVAQVERLLPIAQPEPGRSIEAVTPDGEEDAVCIEVAAADRLYVTDGFVVTHNTISAATAVSYLAHAKDVRNVLIVCPLAVVPHWRRTLRDVGVPAGVRICVINYDRLKSLLSAPASASKAKRKSTKNRHTARSGEPLVDWDMVIYDESHQTKNKDAQRSMAAARLAKYHLPAAQAPFVVWMSATAGQNPTELSYLAPLLAQVTRSRASSLKDFGPWLQEHGFHVVEDPRWDKWLWTDDPSERAADIVLMKRMLFDRKTPVALRRLPTDLAGWPEIQRILLPVDLTLANRALYEQAWTEFRHEMRLVAKGRNPSGGMVVQLRFRQKASLLRTEGTVGHTLDLLDNDHQVAISVQFIETLDAIRATLERQGVAVAVMDGRTPATRETERVRFQRGDAHVVLFTPAEGFSLHESELLPDGTTASAASRSLIVHDPRYSGIQAIQIEGRCHRDGKAANVYYAFSTGTVEEKIVATLLDRMESTKALVGDDTTLIRDLERVLRTG